MLCCISYTKKKLLLCFNNKIDNLKFSEFNFHHDILEGLESMGFEETTPIQEESIPVIMEGSDLIACAQTGTGKTAAYLLPMINEIVQSEEEGMKAIIIAPTRELAQQIDQQMSGFGYFMPVSSIAIYGGGDGVSWDQQKAALIGGADVVIATPGRLIAHLNFDYVDTSKLKFLILDEADRMLDMGFYDDIMTIIKYLKGDWQTLMFSATMPPKIRLMANKILKDPAQVDIAISKPAEGINQQAYMVYEPQKIELIKSVLKETDVKSIIVFSGTKSNVKILARDLKKEGYSAEAIHSDLEQEEREKVMLDFRNKKVQMLVATNIVSRGIDIEGIDLIINYDVPRDAEDYIHRIGRTARAESSGMAITLITEKDQDYFLKIEQMIEKEVTKIELPEGFEKGPKYDPESGKKRRFPRGKGPRKGDPSRKGQTNRPKGKPTRAKKHAESKESPDGMDVAQSKKARPQSKNRIPQTDTEGQSTSPKKKKPYWKKKRKNRNNNSTDGAAPTT